MTDPSARLAAKLASLAPGDLNRVHFTTGGSTAVDTAARMVVYVQSCLGFPEKIQLVARENSYHGSTFLSQSVGKRPGDRVEEFRSTTDGIPHLSAPDQAWLLNEAAFSLRALGRLTEAVEPMRVALKQVADAEDWKRAAGGAGNLSELEVTLGRLGEAAGGGGRATAVARRRGGSKRAGSRPPPAAARRGVARQGRQGARAATPGRSGRCPSTAGRGPRS